jgi:hypothetical protein
MLVVSVVMNGLKLSTTVGSWEDSIVSVELAAACAETAPAGAANTPAEAAAAAATATVAEAPANQRFLIDRAFIADVPFFQHRDVQIALRACDACAL